jgi:hypothetical protein
VIRRWQSKLRAVVCFCPSNPIISSPGERWCISLVWPSSKCAAWSIPLLREKDILLDVNIAMWFVVYRVFYFILFGGRGCGDVSQRAAACSALVVPVTSCSTSHNSRGF